jgi:predicted transposase YbfD/YdcC
LPFGTVEKQNFSIILGKIKDPRRLNRGNYIYPLLEIMFVAVASAVCGITEWQDMEDFGNEKIDWFRKYYPYQKGIPSHDTISRLFAKLCPVEFCKHFTQWVESIREPIDKEVIAIDGKAVKGSAQKSKGIKSLYFVSAYASENELVLGQEIVDEKSNEITAVPKLLDMIDCKGAIITVDALNTQTQIAKKIIDKQADYIMALKGNQGEIYEQVKERFSRQMIDSIDTTHDLGHGRVETRTCSVIKDLTFIDKAIDWVNIKCVIKIDSNRYFKATGKTEQETRYYICSLDSDAQLINKSVRNHWAIENKLHWMLDVGFREDASRKRKDNSTANYGMICKIALNMIKQTKGTGSYKRRKFKALINDAHREKIMGLF